MSSDAHTLLTTRQAAEFCAFKTAGAIRKAVMEGRLNPVGRRGGRGTMVFRREDLEAFMLGRTPRAIPDAGRPRVPPPGGHNG
jgi:hypothetical protein